MATTHNPSDPGEVLRAWLAGITVANPAAWLDVTRVALSHVFNGAAGIIPDMDLRLAATLNTTPDKLVRHAKRLRHVAGAKIIPRYGSPHHVAIGGQLTDCRMTLHAGEFQKLRYNNKGAGSFAALRLSMSQRFFLNIKQLPDWCRTSATHPVPPILFPQSPSTGSGQV